MILIRGTLTGGPECLHGGCRRGQMRPVIANDCALTDPPRNAHEVRDSFLGTLAECPRVLAWGVTLASQFFQPNVLCPKICPKLGEIIQRKFKCIFL